LQGGDDGIPVPAAMSADLSWDKFRLVKAIADCRSLGGAAQILGLNHSTIFRRLAALESNVGAPLFERSRAGYDPTAAGDEMIALAGSMADSITEFERRIAGRDFRPTGQLRVTTAEAIGQHFLPALMAQFQEQNPGVVIELILANPTLNLSRREADVALRLTNDPPETLVGRRIGPVRWALYCRREAVGPANSLAIEAVRMVGFCETFGSPSVRRWIETHVRPDQVAARVNSIHGALGLTVQGVGAALLPCFLGDSQPALIRAGPPNCDLDSSLWILTHSDLRRSARVRAFMDFAGTEMTKHRRLLEGAQGETGVALEMPTTERGSARKE
jgi:DNA-binding transcriptional LysR family regulator